MLHNVKQRSVKDLKDSQQQHRKGKKEGGEKNGGKERVDHYWGYWRT